MAPRSKPTTAKPPGAKRGRAAASPLIYAAAAGAAVVAAVVYYLVFASKIVTVRPTNADALKEVFFSGEPWLIECGRSGSPALYAAEASLRKGTRAGLLDCSATLPSGKTTLERFKIAPHKRGPTILMFSNVDRPVLAPMDAVRTGADLAKWSNRLAQPRSVTVATPAQFEQHCARRKLCFLVLAAGSRMPPGEKAAIASLAGAHRAVRFVTLEVSKMNLAPELLALGGGLPAPTKDRSTVLLLKQLGGADSDEGEKRHAAQLLEQGLADAPAASAALAAALGSAALPAGFVPLEASPTVELKKAPPPPPREQSATSATSGGGEGTTLTDEQLKVLRATREVER